MKTFTATSRVQCIDWSRIGTNVDTAHCAKVNEFLRLAAALYRRTGTISHQPFNEAADVLSLSKIEAANECASRMAISEFPLVSRIVRLYLCASELASLGVENAPELSRMYEPLIDVIEDGGVLDMHHGELVTDDTWSKSLDNWIERYGNESS